MNTRTKGEQFAYGTEMTVQITAVWCPGCGVPYGLSESFRERRQSDHKSWTCPNGCSLSFPIGSSEIEKKAKQLEDEKARLERQLASVRSDREWQREQRLTAERRGAAARGQVTKIKNRVAAGVCPCCNRTFQNVAKHMAGQHPDFAGSES